MAKRVESQNFRVPFFLLGMGFLGVSVWAVYDEVVTRRPWVGVQQDFWKLEEQQALLALEEARAELESGPARAELDAIEEELAKLGDAEACVDGFKAELDALKEEAKDANLQLTFLKSEVDEFYYRFKKAEHDANFEEKKFWGDKILEYQGEDWAGKNLDEICGPVGQRRQDNQSRICNQLRIIDDAEKLVKDKEAEIAATCKLEEKKKLEKRRNELMKPVLDAEARVAAVEEHKGIWGWLITEIIQINLPEIDRVDRCQTCHMASDRLGYYNDPTRLDEDGEPDHRYNSFTEPFLSHSMRSALLGTHPPERFGCTTCHLGQGRATFESLAHGPGDHYWEEPLLWAPKKEDYHHPGPTWDEPHVWNLEDYPGFTPRPADFVQAGCVRCHNEDMSLFAKVPCQTDNECSTSYGYPEGYVCGTFDQRAAEAVSQVALVAALAQNSGEDVQAAVDKVMGPILNDARASTAVDEAQAAAVDAAVEAVKEGKNVWEAAAIGRAAAAEILKLPAPAETPAEALERMKLEDQQTQALVERLGVGAELFAQLNSKAPTQKFCTEDKTDIQRVDVAPVFTKGKMIVREVGCYGCHPIKGFEDLPNPGPALDRLKSKVNPGWLVAWIKNPKDFRPNTRMPNFFPEAIDESAVKDGWDAEGNPLGRYFGYGGEIPNPKKVSAQEYQQALYDFHAKWGQKRDDESLKMAAFLLSISQDEKSPIVKGAGRGGNPENGKILFETRGCTGCHQVQPRPLYDPTNVDPETGELAAQDPNPTQPYKNFYSHFDGAPNLSNIGAKTNEDWLFAWLKNPKALQPDTRMPSLRLSDEDARDLTAYLMQQRQDQSSPNGGTLPAYETPDALLAPSATFIEEGKRLVQKYGCFNCHDIPGFEGQGKIGADLSEFGEKLVSLLDFGDVFPDHDDQLWEVWVEQKLLHPRSYRTERVETKMPYFQLRPDEVYAVMIMLRGMRADLKLTPLHKVNTPEEKAFQEGRFLIARYNCWGCHKVDGKDGAIYSYFEGRSDLGDDSETRRSFGPPSLMGEGARVRPEWFFNFLKNVVFLRPWLEKTQLLEGERYTGLRMPSFDLSDKEASTIVAYFAAQDGEPFPYQSLEGNSLTRAEALKGRELFDKAQCKSCHPYNEPGQGPDLALARDRLQGNWILRWLISPAKTPPGTGRMPPFFIDAAHPENGQLASPLPDILGGDPAAQITLLRDYLLVYQDCPPDESKPCNVGQPGDEQAPASNSAAPATPPTPPAAPTDNPNP